MLNAIHRRFLAWRFNRLFVKPFEAKAAPLRKGHRRGAASVAAEQRAYLHAALAGGRREQGASS